MAGSGQGCAAARAQFNGGAAVSISAARGGAVNGQRGVCAESSRRTAAKLASRAERFKEHLSEPARGCLPSQHLVDGINQLKLSDDNFALGVQGTCTALEKPYLRLTRAPAPAEVRPVAVLRQALQLFRGQWAVTARRPSYLFMNEQLKSIRQDLTVQCVRDAFTVEVYECHACIALEALDREEFNQCASQLKVLYEEGVAGRRLELTAYRLLYYLATKDSTQLNTTLASLSPSARREPHVAFALQARAALALNNYCAFFRLLPRAPGHCAAALGWVLARERTAALDVLVKAYRPHLPLSFLRRTLGLEESAAGREASAALLKDCGVEEALLADDKLDCKLAASLRRRLP